MLSIDGVRVGEFPTIKNIIKFNLNCTSHIQVKSNPMLLDYIKEFYFTMNPVTIVWNESRVASFYIEGFEHIEPSLFIELSLNPFVYIKEIEKDDTVDNILDILVRKGVING